MIPCKAPVKTLATAIFFATVCLFFSCKKTDTVNTVIEQPADFSKKVTASVNGFVTNELNSPVAGAKVQYGESFSTTDQYGFFEIKDATVVENAGVVTVIMTGYFKGIKTFIAEAGKKNFCRIKLIPKINSGNVDAATGGDVVLPNGLKVSLPAAGIMDAATKAPYSGIVNVSSFWINPIADDIDKIMPGDLRGINANGSLKSLTSFGMAAIELTGNAGQMLQIAEGKKATLTFPLPNTVAADAPASIPLWYFDEAKGLWIEEGNAIKTGNSYVGDVKHFSYWNCDMPNATIPLSFTVTDSSNNPLGNVLVNITPLTNDTWGHIGGHTDESGYVHVPVAANTQYKLEMLTNCNAAFPFSRNFAVADKPIAFGNIIINAGSQFMATITGTISNCGNAPLNTGRILISGDNTYSSFTANANGMYNFTLIKCNGLNRYTFIAEDQFSLEQGLPITYTITAGNNNIGNLQACGVSTAEFIHYTLNDSSYTFTPPGDSLVQYTGPGFTNIGSWNLTTGVFVGLRFDFSSDMTVANQPNLISFGSSQLNPQGGHVQPVTPITVNLTEFGPVGGFIAGSFSGLINSLINNPVNMSCNFRIKRRY